MPGWSWRWGLKAPYGWEQFSFWWRLWPRLLAGRFDVLHVQDPMLALWCRMFRRCGLVKTREILAHGTEEPPGFMAAFDYVQHLAPVHLEDVLAELEPRSERATDASGPGRTRHAGRLWTAIPNFVDTDMFLPATDAAAGRAARQRLGIPAHAFVVGTVAVVKRTHKRIDRLIDEFAACPARTRPVPAGRTGDGSTASGPPYLLIAGARHADSDALMRMAEDLVPGRFRMIFDLPRDRMPDVYRAMDVFVLASLFEMMPIALLEALASGVPVVTNRQPVLAWMAGSDSAPCGGCCIDMETGGELARVLDGLSAGQLSCWSRGARQRAVAMFSTDIVMERCLDYYRAVISDR
jgi:glycosyltransferase involved in cell wall biosynthesis